MSGYRRRHEDVADDAVVVVRGGLLDRARLTLDATLAFRRFGEYGVSVLAAADEAALDVIASSTLQREPVLTLMRMGTFRAAGLEVRPTFRRPHFTVMLPDLDADIDRLVACDNVVRDNRYYVAPEGER